MLLTENDFIEIISCRRRGWGASLCRVALRGAEMPYAAAVRWRNRRFDRTAAAIERVGVPVVSVGNLTAGGTGKTPMVRWIARWFRQHQKRVVIVSRGYRAEGGGRNDEALELERRLPDVPHLQNPDRVAAARLAITEFESQLVVLDDGFQHRRIARDLDLVLIDALQPFGFGHLLPRGLLREPPASLRRADVIAISRADLVSEDERRALVEAIREFAPATPVCQVSHQPEGWSQASGTESPLDKLSKHRIAAFCGIGNPLGFRKTLERCPPEVIAFRTFADHYAYQREDIESLAAWAEAEKVDAVVCTAKDLVKLRVDRLGRLPLYALDIGIAFQEGQAVLEERLQELLEK